MPQEPKFKIPGSFIIPSSEAKSRDHYEEVFLITTQKDHTRNDWLSIFTKETVSGTQKKKT